MIHQLEDVENRTNQTPECAPSQAVPQSASSKLCHFVEEKPMKSVLIGLGIGVGTGILLGSVLRGSAKYLTNDEALIERIGNNVKHSLAEMVPSSLTKHFRS